MDKNSIYITSITHKNDNTVNIEGYNHKNGLDNPATYILENIPNSKFIDSLTKRMKRGERVII